MKAGKAITWVIFILFAITIGLYPVMYYLSEVLMENGLLSQKPPDIQQMWLWRLAFHVHITLGGLSLLTGWSQFLKGFRNRNLNLHRLLGKVYLIAVLFSGLAGLYMAIYAEGGILAKLGFGGLAVFWLFTSYMAWTTVKRKEINAHRDWMIRSYALAFAAVTLRIWLPLFQFGIGMEFFKAYVIIAWLCWVPNLAWAEWKIRSRAQVV